MQFILDHEYVLTLFASLAIFLFCFPKRKLFYLTFALSFFLIELYWHFRPLPGPLDFLIIYLLLIGSAYLTFNTNIFGVLFIVTTTFCVQHIAYKGTMILVTLIDYNLRGQIFYVLMELFIIVVMNAIMYFTFLFPTGQSKHPYPAQAFGTSLSSAAKASIFCNRISSTCFFSEIELYIPAMPMRPKTK